MKAQSAEQVMDAAEARFRAIYSARSFSYSAFVADGNAVTVNVVAPGMFLLTAFSPDGLCLGCKTAVIESAVKPVAPVQPVKSKGKAK